MAGVALSDSGGGSLGASRFAPLFETVLAFVAIAALLPAFVALQEHDTGRDRRFADSALSVGGLPDAVLPQLCRDYSAQAEASLQARLCRNEPSAPASVLATRMPQSVADAADRARQAFIEPLNEAQNRLTALRVQQREGIGDLLDSGDTIQAFENDLQPFMKRFALEGMHGLGPAPLHCARSLLDAALARPAVAAPDDTGLARHNALLLFGAALDGHGATPALAHSALVPASAARPAPGCQGLADELSRLSEVMAQARQSTAHSQKNAAMRSLLLSAGWQWAAWMLLGLGLLKLSRQRVSPAKGVALSLAVWAVAAWAGSVPWPFSAQRSLLTGRVSPDWWALPAPYVVAMLSIALGLLMLSKPLDRRLATAPQTMASRIGYPGLVLATGLGWALLLDLSANGHLATRYLALYHQGHLWLGLLMLSVLLFLRQPLARALGWSLALIDELAHGAVRRLGSVRARAALALLVLALVGAIGLVLANMRQLTSEIGRVWLIVGSAWFFFLRGNPLAERLAREPGSLRSLLRYVWPLLVVASVLLAWAVVTRDMGPLLIAAYGAGAFLAASAGMWWHLRQGGTVGALALAVVLFAGWIAVLTVGLFQLGAVDEVTAARLESVAAPLASANDQLALVTWFRKAAPVAGFGLGAVPWCGYASTGCSGVPLQLPSDYTFTALAGALGEPAGWTFTLAMALWLHRLVRHHGRVTRGEPRLIQTAGGLSNDDQAFLSWLCVAWAVLTLCQLAVTVAGNLAVLPLTGVTFPFVSFGMTSLLVNMAFLALCLNINRPSDDPHG